MIEFEVGDLRRPPLLVFVARNAICGLDVVLVVADFVYPLPEGTVCRGLGQREHHFCIVDALAQMQALELEKRFARFFLRMRKICSSIATISMVFLGTVIERGLSAFKYRYDMTI